MIRALSVIALVSVLAGCQRTGSVALPEWPNAARTLLLGAIRESERGPDVFEYYAITRDGQAPEAISLDPEQPLFAVFHVLTPTSLGLAPGPGRATTDAVGDPITLSASTFIQCRRGNGANLDPDCTDQWEPYEMGSPIGLDRFKLPQMTSCAGAGACSKVEDRLLRCDPECERPNRPELTVQAQPPQPFEYGDCPQGWAPEAMPGTGVGFCRPPSCREPGMIASLSGACVPAAGGCSVIDVFPSGAPDPAPKLYVLASAAAGGSGTEASPFQTISEAMAAATPGTWILIGAGDYDERLIAAGPPVTLLGSCAQTTIRDAFEVRSGAELRQLRLIGARRMLLVNSTATATIADVEINNTGGRDSTTISNQGRLRAERFLFEGAKVVQNSNDAELQLVEGRIDTTQIGIEQAGGSVTTDYVEFDGVVESTAGILAFGGTVLTVENSHFHEGERGIRASAVDTGQLNVRISQVFAEDLQQGSNDQWHTGAISIDAAPTVEIDHVVSLNNFQGIYLWGVPDGRVATFVVDRSENNGLTLAGGTVHATDAYITRSSRFGVEVRDFEMSGPPTATLEHFTIANNTPADGLEGEGLVTFGNQINLSVDRMLIRNVNQWGFRIYPGVEHAANSVFLIKNLTVDGVTAGARGADAVGFEAGDFTRDVNSAEGHLDASLNVEFLTITNTEGDAVRFSGEGFKFKDVSISNIGERAMLIIGNSHEVESLDIQEIDTAFSAIEVYATVDLFDVSIEGSIGREADIDCDNFPDSFPGTGIAARLYGNSMIAPIPNFSVVMGSRMRVRGVRNAFLVDRFASINVSATTVERVESAILNTTANSEAIFSFTEDSRLIEVCDLVEEDQ